MRNFIIFALTALLAAPAISGCTIPEGENGRGEQIHGITVNKIEFEKIKLEELSPDKKSVIEKVKGIRGYYTWEEDGSFIIFIASGKKPTGGFSIDVKSIEDIEGITRILVVEKSPAPGDMVTMAITYPYVIVKARGITDNFNIENTKGEKFTKL